MYVLSLCLLSLFIKHSIENQWNYDVYAPNAWQAEFLSCKGQEQSPIAITKERIIYDPRLKPFEFIDYDKTYDWIVSNENFTLKFDGVYNNSFMNATIRGSDFIEDYFLMQFHFHWSAFNNSISGSEHVLFNNSFPLEMHFVHRSKTGKLSVLGFLFQLSKENNPILETILNPIRKVNNSTDTHLARFKLNSFLPNPDTLTSYFRYKGSLTTPPCTEGILWNIFENRINISEYQMKAFRESSIKSNVRFPQNIYSRTIYSSVYFPPNISSVIISFRLLIQSLIVFVLFINY